jgi:ABC-type cobalamin transport system permease subunit
LPECPDHHCSANLKGKPQSILCLPCFINTNLSSLCLMHYVAGVDWKHLMHIISLSRNISWILCRSKIEYMLSHA